MLHHCTIVYPVTGDTYPAGDGCNTCSCMMMPDGTLVATCTMAWCPPQPQCYANGITYGEGELPWWRHQMETFSALLAICAGNSPVNGEFPAQRPVTRSFDVFFDLRLNKRLSKQSWGWWFETLSLPLWRNCIGSTVPLFEKNTVLYRVRIPTIVKWHVAPVLGLNKPCL